MPTRPSSATAAQLARENAGLRAQLEEAEETLRAIRSGEVDSLIITGAEGEEVYSLTAAKELLEASNRARLALLEVIEEQKRTEETLRHRLAELEALHQVSFSLRAAADKQEALPILLDETLAALETDTGAILIAQDVTGELISEAHRGWFTNLYDDPAAPTGMAAHVFRTGLTHIVQEFRTDPLASSILRQHAPQGWGGACTPIRTGDATTGVMFASLPPQKTVSSHQIRLLESLAEMAGTALHRMRLHEEATRQLRQLQSLRSIDLAITSSVDLQFTLDVLLENVAKELQADASRVLLYNPEQGTLELLSEIGLETKVMDNANVHLGTQIAGRVARSRQPVYIRQLEAQVANPDMASHSALRDFASYYAAPLIAKGKVKGVLEFLFWSEFEPNDDWLRFMDALAGQAAIAIDNAGLFEGLQRTNLELILAYDATIEGWSHAMDLRDKETEGHTLRVTNMAERLARLLGLPDEDIVHIHRGGLLHDIGKMGVPDQILLKPGPLTDDEWVLMRRHPQFAFEMLSPIHYLGPALDIPYCHHEKWDGTGYPRGLKGEQIPLSARLFAVVDVWDALTSDRPYRPAWTHERTLDHIREQSGKHFDPAVVSAFLQMQATFDQRASGSGSQDPMPPYP